MDQKIAFLRHMSDKSETFQHHVHGTPDVYSNPASVRTLLDLLWLYVILDTKKGQV